ncbi:uncharacterized protein LOC143282446 [Babylonia areolata]|uniref:uncharacterized protein LOC143282446 n=1 Tax=Babylonia areolata TaxID=304850 RepID=UPI003FD4E7FF
MDGRHGQSPTGALRLVVVVSDVTVDDAGAKEPAVRICALGRQRNKSRAIHRPAAIRRIMGGLPGSRTEDVPEHVVLATDGEQEVARVLELTAPICALGQVQKHKDVEFSSAVMTIHMDGTPGHVMEDVPEHVVLATDEEQEPARVPELPATICALGQIQRQEAVEQSSAVITIHMDGTPGHSMEDVPEHVVLAADGEQEPARVLGLPAPICALGQIQKQEDVELSSAVVCYQVL